MRPSIQRKPFFITSPELATVGESGPAYLQRFLVIALGITCIAFDYYNGFADCRLIRLPRHTHYDQKTETSDGLEDFANAVDHAISAVGIEPFEPEHRSIWDHWSFRKDSSEWESFYPGWKNYSESEKQGYYDAYDEYWDGIYAVVYGPWSGFAILDHDQQDVVTRDGTHRGTHYYECEGWAAYWEGVETSMKDNELTYFRCMHAFFILPPLLGMLGVFCASIETLFVVFYPSVLAGAVLLASAAASEIAWLTMYLIALWDCFDDQKCVLDVNFYTYLVVIVGYCLSSCLLVFGLRAYPWCLRKNRDPRNCRAIDPEIVSERDVDAPTEERTIQSIFPTEDGGCPEGSTVTEDTGDETLPSKEASQKPLH